MTLATDNGAEASSDDRRVEEGESTTSPADISSKQSHPLLAGLAQEHYILADVAANMRSGFILINRTGQVTYSNPSAQRLLGINDLLPPFDVRKRLLSLAADPDYARSELDRVWRHPEQESSTDLALADAAVRWLRVQSFPVRDVPGHLLGRGVLLDDVTLERSSAQERSETLALAAHELKTPLAIIKGCATTLLGSSMRWDPSLQREMLQMIDTHTDRLHDILNTLLDVWRLDAGAQNLRLAQVNIVELLQRLVERWQKQAIHHRFVLHMPDTAPTILCDALRLEQALNSLLNNAVTYSPNGGIITIRLEANDVEIRFSISDEGIGIAVEHLDNIFNRFYRVARNEESPRGSGLGLSVARATIEAHGGKIWADSPGLGLGATFYCTLPLAPRLAISQPAAQQTQHNFSSLSGPLAAPHTDAHNVLVVENDARIARYLRTHLEEHRYQVHTINSGVQFLRRLDLEEPHLILLSTRLADTSGIELLQRLREFSQIPVIILCDACDEDERVHLFDLGADDVITKPFGMKELLARVRTILRRATATEAVPAQPIFTNGELTIDYSQHLVLLQGRSVQLSRTEYKLLSVLAQNVGIVLTHELLLERVWGSEYNRDVDFIWVYISRLRRKIETDSRHPRYILTVPDVGYKLAKL
jgi:DNA-binding response OmpR family regulator/signal transduction histidine kinase